MIDSSVTPFLLVIGLFVDVDSRGLPTSSTGDQIDCLTSPRCQITNVSNGLEVRIAEVGGAKVAVFRAAYLKPQDNSTPNGKPEEPIVLSASWALRMTSEDAPKAIQ